MLYQWLRWICDRSAILFSTDFTANAARTGSAVVQSNGRRLCLSVGNLSGFRGDSDRLSHVSETKATPDRHRPGCQTARHRVPEGKSSTGRKNTSASSILTTRKHEKLAHTRLPSIGFRNWSRFLAVSLQVTWIVNPAVGCHYFPPGPQLPPQPLRGLLPVSLLGEQRHDGCKQFAWDCYPTALRLQFEPRPWYKQTDRCSMYCIPADATSTTNQHRYSVSNNITRRQRRHLQCYTDIIHWKLPIPSIQLLKHSQDFIILHSS